MVVTSHGRRKHVPNLGRPFEDIGRANRTHRRIVDGGGSRARGTAVRAAVPPRRSNGRVVNTDARGSLRWLGRGGSSLGLLLLGGALRHLLRDSSNATRVSVQGLNTKAIGMSSDISTQVQQRLHDIHVFLGDGLITGRVRRVKEMNDTLSGLASQGMRGDSDILRFLDGLRVQEGETTLPYRADHRVIWERVGLQGDMDDDGVVRQAVEMRDGGEKGRRARNDGNRSASL
ncbi:uncharacterized protein LDX57_007293 [Aspergillus melleus]|uniref:uncharacterized protein n=1 Tax=Aspergillus melleus TaxID=138277 RepID=UPI001E8D75AB|nr:uncharacterized protein LDX57_007293 [Aspergillus melleus]KAH8429622.1 hypothetical protein LDX57_007293 [Aspergillus melleus]